MQQEGETTEFSPLLLAWSSSWATPFFPQLYFTFHSRKMAKGSIKLQASVCCSVLIRSMELGKSNHVNKYTSSPTSGHISLGSKRALVRQPFWGTEELHWQERTSETSRLVHQPSEQFIHQYKTRMVLSYKFISLSILLPLAICQLKSSSLLPT